jgi:hypothetical protein
MFYNPALPGSPEDASVPIVFTKVGHKILIKFVLDTALKKKIKRGEIVESIENKDAFSFLRSKEQYLSGSPQCKERDALTYLAQGVAHSSFKMVVNHHGISQKIIIPRNVDAIPYREGNFSPLPTKDGQLKNDIYYYNLSNDSAKKGMMKQLLGPIPPKAVILDMRNYPKDDMIPLIQQLLIKPDTTAWLFIPQIIYPDHEKITYTDISWPLYPKQPHIGNKIYLLIDASTMSAAESFAGYFKDFGLATIIGQPTAGTNGAATFFKLPGQNDTDFSGMLVTNHDGSKHHLNGIIPDIVVNPTIKGIEEGKDEILERAIIEAQRYNKN